MRSRFSSHNRALDASTQMEAREPVRRWRLVYPTGISQRIGDDAEHVPAQPFTACSVLSRRCVCSFSVISVAPRRLSIRCRRSVWSFESASTCASVPASHFRIAVLLRALVLVLPLFERKHAALKFFECGRHERSLRTECDIASRSAGLDKRLQTARLRCIRAQPRW